MSAGDADFGLEISKGVLAKFLMAAIGFAGSVIFARVLGPSGYGAFYVLLTLVNVLDNPVTGWGIACKKRISETGFSTEEALGSGLLGALIFPVVLLPFVYLFVTYTDYYQIGDLLLPFGLLFVAICLFAVTNRVLSARANFSAADWSDTLRSVFTTPLQLAFVLLGFGAAGMAYGLAIATLLTVPYVLYRIGVRPKLPSRTSLESIGEFAKYSIPNGFIGTAQSQVDILLLGAILTSTAVGEYQVAFQLTLPGTFVAGVASAGLMARVSQAWSENDDAAVRTDLSNSLGFASILTVPIFFGAAAMPNALLVTIFGGQYGGVGMVLVGLALFRVVHTQTLQLGAAVAGLDRPDLQTVIGGVTLVVNVGLGYALILEVGLAGVVAATVVSELVKYGLVVYFVKRELPNLRVLTEPFRHQLIAGGAMFLVVEPLHSTFGVDWWLDLALLVGAGGLVYFAVLVAISDPFRVTVRGVAADAMDR